MAAPAGWQTALLKLLGAPVTTNAVKALTAWQRAEGGTAAFNPLNTTQPAPGATSYNTVGVRNYPTYQEGLKATAATLLNGRYGPIVQALRTGAAPVALARAVAASPWGTGSGVLRVLGTDGGTAPSPAARAAPSIPAPTPAPALPPELANVFAANDAIIGVPSLNLAALTPPAAVNTAAPASVKATGARAKQLPGLKYLNVASGVDVSDVDPQLVARVNALGQYLAQHGKTLTVTSGYRSTAKQAQLYARYKAGGTIAAPPGRSNHNTGQAVDLTVDGQPVALAVPASILRRYGLNATVPGDPVHVTRFGVRG